MKPEQWIVGNDTGVSSKTIWSVMFGVNPDWQGVPLDVDDFGRCVRLLTLVKEFRPRLKEVSVKYPEWKPIIDDWDELERLYWAWEAQDKGSKERGEAWNVFYIRLHGK